MLPSIFRLNYNPAVSVCDVEYQYLSCLERVEHLLSFQQKDIQLPRCQRAFHNLHRRLVVMELCTIGLKRNQCIEQMGLGLYLMPSQNRIFLRLV